MTDRAKLDGSLLDQVQRIAKRAYRALDLVATRASTSASTTTSAST